MQSASARTALAENARVTKEGAAPSGEVSVHSGAFHVQWAEGGERCTPGEHADGRRSVGGMK